MPTDRSPERAERRDRTNRPRVGPLSFDERELSLSVALRLHVLTRDACLASTSLMPIKIAALDEVLLASMATLGANNAWLHRQVSIVALIGHLRRHITESSVTLDADRRRLVILDLLATAQPAPGTAWSRPLDRLIGEATACTGTGIPAADVTRLARRLARARRACHPEYSIQTETPVVGALAEAAGGVLSLSPGAAVAIAYLLLSGCPTTTADLSRAGGLLLDPLPAPLSWVDQTSPTYSGRYLGTMIASEAPQAFPHELATLQVAASLSTTIASYTVAALLSLATDLWREGVAASDEAAGARLRACAKTAFSVAGTLPTNRHRRAHLRRPWGN